MQHLLAQPGATHTERQAYLQGVDGFPGPVDRWLIANSRTPRINFLDNYLMLDDPSCEYVTCIVEPRREIVSDILSDIASYETDNLEFWISRVDSIYR